MKLHNVATALSALMALSIGTPAAAGTVPIDYSLSISGNGQVIPFGTMILDYDGSAYSLESLLLTLPKKSSIVTSYVTLAPVSGTSDYCLYTFSACSVVAEENSLYVVFDPSLISQTSTLYVYSTTNLATESLSVIIQRAASVPEPATWTIMLLGLGAIGSAVRRKRTPLLARG